MEPSYIGVTDDLDRRVTEHVRRVYPECFTARYHVYRLVYYETHKTIDEAMIREQKLKHYLRKWKIELIEKHNPEWRDLSGDLVKHTGSSVVALGNPEDV